MPANFVPSSSGDFQHLPEDAYGVARSARKALNDITSLKNYDAKSDARQFSDAVMTSGSAVLTSATASFAASDVGKMVAVAGAGAAGANLLTTVISRSSATQVTLAQTAGTTVPAARGAIGTDNTTAIQNSFAALKVAGGGLWLFPPGNYLWTGVPFLSSASDFALVGNGAKLVCTRDDLPPLRPNFWSRFSIEGISVSHACKTARSAGGDGVRLTACTDYLIKGVFVSDVTCMGITNYLGCSRGTITGSTVVDNLADGIHVTGASKDITVQGNHCERTGDDLFACVAYTGTSAQNERIAFIGNTGGDNPLGRGIAVTGGKGVVVSGNTLYNTGSAGILVAQDTGHDTLGSEDVVIVGNTLTGAVTAVNQGAIDIRGGDPTRPVKNVQIATNIIRGWGYRAISIGSSTAGTSLVSVHNNKLIGPGTVDQPAINVQFTDHCDVTKNKIYFANKEAIDGGNNTGFHDYSDNTIYYPNQSGNAETALYIDTANGRCVDNTLFVDPAHTLTKPFDVFQAAGLVAYDNIIGGTPTRTRYRAPGQTADMDSWRNEIGGTLSGVSFEGRFVCANDAQAYFEKFLGGSGQNVIVGRAPAATSGVTSQRGVNLQTTYWDGSASVPENCYWQSIRQSVTVGDMRMTCNEDVEAPAFWANGVNIQTWTDPKPSRFLRVGNYCRATPGAGTNNAQTGTNTLRLSPCWVPRTITIDRLMAEVTTIGDVGSKHRLGIYADDGTGYPGALVLDAGINGDTLNAQSITVNQTLAPGLYWVGGATQIVTTTQPTMRCNSGADGESVGTPTTPTTLTFVSYGYQQTAVNGALPATFTTTPVISGTSIVVVFRVSA